METFILGVLGVLFYWEGRLALPFLLFLFLLLLLLLLLLVCVCVCVCVCLNNVRLYVITILIVAFNCIFML